MVDMKRNAETIAWKQTALVCITGNGNADVINLNRIIFAFYNDTTLNNVSAFWSH